MSDTSSNNKADQVRISELILSAKNLSRQIERMRKRRMLGEKVVDLEEYRRLRVEKAASAVLLIDNDDSLRDGLERSLRKDSVDVITAGDPRELTMTIENQSFDIIVLDVGLPWLDGYEFCRLMKSQKLLRDIPIILLNYDVARENTRRGFEVGCDEYLSKPIKPEKLAQNVRFFLNP